MSFEILPIPDDTEPPYPDPQDLTGDYDDGLPSSSNDRNNSDYNPYGLVYDQRGKRVPSTTHDVLSDAACEIGDTMSWQLLAIRGSLDQDTFEIDVLSKGLVPDTRSNDFGDIADCVAVNPEPSSALKKIHALTFNGNRVQMDDFIIYLRDKLAFPVGVDEDPLKNIPLPALMFASMLGRKQPKS